MSKATTVLELLSKPERWTQRAYKRDANGKPTAYSCGTVSWCISGAIHEVYGDSDKKESEARAKLLVVIPDDCLPEWNDAPGRTYDEVIAKVREAGI